ncbi:hypothetical protein B0T16DRAFT_384111 [Cercophora newfieldiana]|uniref:Uncharacterized protein n=1 Tax=Cercophora newfieldiana TaxID=92897 RepID=A0AA40CZV2_9PEZI|nr:hypothetical protein B0T16DRAFT_384111 [Cercophora newfieldiana]
MTISHAIYKSLAIEQAEGARARVRRPSRHILSCNFPPSSSVASLLFHGLRGRAVVPSPLRNINCNAERDESSCPHSLSALRPSQWQGDKLGPEPASSIRVSFSTSNVRKHPYSSKGTPANYSGNMPVPTQPTQYHEDNMELFGEEIGRPSYEH